MCAFWQQKFDVNLQFTIIDARLKPHRAPPLIENPEVTARVDRLFAPGRICEKQG